MQSVYTGCCTSNSILIYIHTGSKQHFRGCKGAQRKPFKTGSMWFETSRSCPSRRRYCDTAVSVRVSCDRAPVETEDDLVVS